MERWLNAVSMLAWGWTCSSNIEPTSSDVWISVEDDFTAAVKIQKTVTAYFSSKQLLHFEFAQESEGTQANRAGKVITRKHEMLVQCRFNVRPPSTTLAQH